MREEDVAEGKWFVSGGDPDCTMLFSLKDTGFRRGSLRFRNDVMVTITTGKDSLTDVRDILPVIRAALENTDDLQWDGEKWVLGPNLL